jgi:hypothetical protein
MRVLLCFDVDGTLDSSAGPVPFARLRELVRLGAEVAIVSPSLNWPVGMLPALVAGPGRLDNLVAAALKYPAELNLYISDNPGDEEVAKQAGFAFVRPEHFR